MADRAAQPLRRPHSGHPPRSPRDDVGGPGEAVESELTSPSYSAGAARSEERVEIVAFNLGVLEDLVEQTWPQYLSCVNRDDRRTAIWMPHEMVTAPGANQDKSSSLKRLDDLPSRDPSQPAHTSTAMR